MNKRYYDFLNDITPNELYEGLLGYGLFAEKLPPIFTSKPFLDFCKENINTFKRGPTNYIYYESIRHTNTPRPMGIPNPFNYEYLCSFLKDNWDKLLDHFWNQTKEQKYIVSRVHIRKRRELKPLFEMNYKNWKEDGTPEPSLLIGAKYIVKVDISQCFPSIYTHALSWALVGKTEAKKERYKKNWYNQLDEMTRNLRNGETHGIIIGPHTSNILSEIILTSVDNKMLQSTSEQWKYIRNIDDYTCFVDSYEKAQLFIAELSEQLRYYDLSLNHKKTEIEKLPTGATEQWVRKINTIIAFNQKNYFDYKDVQYMLDMGIELMHKNKENAAVINYLIKVLSHKELSQNAQDYYTKTIFHLSLLYPYLVTLLETCVFMPFNTPKEEIEKIANSIFYAGMKSKAYEQSSYALYYAIKYDFIIKDFPIEDIIKSGDCILMTLSFFYAKNKNNKDAVKKIKETAKKIQDRGDMDSYWLFVYESLPKSDLKSNWVVLKDKKVSFVNL